MWHPNVCNVILSLKIKSPPNTNKKKFFLSMPKAHNKLGMDKEVAVPPHGAINKAEGERHRQKLPQTINDLKTNTSEPEIREIMGEFILATKICCEEIYPPLRNADVNKVLHSMGDPYGLAI